MDKIYFDEAIGKNYKLKTFNALKLSKLLKNNLIEKNIVLNDYNASSGKNATCDKKTIENPLKAIYEYNNFFLLDKDGEYILMDGFRRLLWYNTPDININVRIYNYYDFDDKSFIEMMVNLNLHKFVSNVGNYLDRGFSLFMKLIFDLNINSYMPSINNYFTTEYEAKNTYGYTSRNDGNYNKVLTKIKHKYFVSDILFLENFINFYGNNPLVGTLLFQMREKYFDKEFNFEKINEVFKIKSSFKDIFDKTFNARKESNNVLMSKLFINVFAEYFGEEVELTLVEKQEKYKILQKQLNKECTEISGTSIIKLTKSTNLAFLKDWFIKNQKELEKIQLKVLIKPKENENLWGLIENDSWRINTYTENNIYYNNQEISISFADLDNKMAVDLYPKTKFRGYNHHNIYYFGELSRIYNESKLRRLDVKTYLDISKKDFKKLFNL